MALSRPLPPVWLMGLGFAPLGVSGVTMLMTVPQLLAANHVPEGQIASVTAIGLIPGFSVFLLSPLLDWRFSRRTYALLFSFLSAACTFAALLNIANVPLLTGLLFASTMAMGLCVAAVGGWFGNLAPTEDKGKLGAWFAAYNLGAGGLAAATAIPLLRGLPYALGAGLLSALILVAWPLYLSVACPPADGRLASESFRDFARDVLALLRKRTVLLTLLLFVLPAASFALTNTLGGFGHDFSVSEQMVGLVGGLGVCAAGVFGSLMTPRLGRRIEPLPLYLMIGGAGALFTLSLAFAPHNATTFVAAMLGENVFQAAAFSVENAIVLRTIGHDNPLAATQFSLLNSATILPLSYMQAFDGLGYGHGGVAGSYLTDALISGGVCATLGLILWLTRGKLAAAITPD